MSGFVLGSRCSNVRSTMEHANNRLERTRIPSVSLANNRLTRRVRRPRVSPCR